MNTWADGPEEFEAQLRRELAEAAEQVEPRRTLADLRARIARRSRHMRRRRLHRAARSEPEPPTEYMPAAAERVWRAHLAAPPSVLAPCWCGRPAAARYCCWRCTAAHDGGWILGPWNPLSPWTDVHTWGCQQRFSQRSPLAAYLNSAWTAGSARPHHRKDRRHDPPVPRPPLPAGSTRPPADVRHPLAASPRPAPAGRERRVRPRPGPRHARPRRRADRRHYRSQWSPATVLLSPPEELDMPNVKTNALLPKGEENGLADIAGALVAEGTNRSPKRLRAVIAIVDTKRVGIDSDTGEEVAQVRFRRVEVLLAVDLGAAEKLLRRSLEARSGQTTLELELEDEIRQAFEQMQDPTSPDDPEDKGKGEGGKGKGTK